MPLSFQRGTIWAGRFGPGGDTVFYAAAWDGRPFQIFRKSPESHESVPITFPAAADILAVSSQGEIAALVDLRVVMPGRTMGTLALASSMGVAPRRVLEDVAYADWGPHGRDLAVAHEVGGRSQLEYPIGTVRYASPGWISHLRVSRDGKRIAFFEHPIAGDDRGAVALLDADGKVRTLRDGWNTGQGLSWSPDEREIWVSGTVGEEPVSIYAVSLEGKLRPLVRTAGALRLLDVAADGRLLAIRQDRRVGISFRPAAGNERDLSLLGSSPLAALSDDGSAVLFTEAGDAGGVAYSACLRKTDGSPAVRLGDGFALALSPDLAWAMVMQVVPAPHLVLMPTGPGQARTIDTAGIGTCHQSTFLPDGKRVVSVCSEAGQGTRLYVQDLAGGKARAISPDGIVHGLQANPVSPDGKWVAAVAADWQIRLYPIDGGDPRVVRGLSPGLLPIRWSSDGRYLYAVRVDLAPTPIQKVDLESGVATTWRTLAPLDPAGVHGFPSVALSRDGKEMAYTYARFSSELYLVTGVR
jgi:Tol biopolymer transport system component